MKLKDSRRTVPLPAAQEEASLKEESENFKQVCRSMYSSVSHGPITLTQPAAHYRRSVADCNVQATGKKTEPRGPL